MSTSQTRVSTSLAKQINVIFLKLVMTTAHAVVMATSISHSEQKSLLQNEQLSLVTLSPVLSYLCVVRVIARDERFLTSLINRTVLSAY